MARKAQICGEPSSSPGTLCCSHSPNTRCLCCLPVLIHTPSTAIQTAKS